MAEFARANTQLLDGISSIGGLGWTVGRGDQLGCYLGRIVLDRATRNLVARQRIDRVVGPFDLQQLHLLCIFPSLTDANDRINRFREQSKAVKHRKTLLFGPRPQFEDSLECEARWKSPDKGLASISD
jgi:hypothetical protein